MSTQRQRAEQFRQLHERPGVLARPNPWDAGSAKMLAQLGFGALAAYGAFLTGAHEISAQGSFSFLDRAVPFAEINGMMKERGDRYN